MSCGNNFGGIWIIIILILLFGCGGNWGGNMGNCCYNNGCNNGCNNDCCC